MSDKKGGDAPSKPPTKKTRKRANEVVPTRVPQVLAAQKGTIDALANRLGWPSSKLSKLRSGTQNPSMPDLQELSEALGLPVSDLLHQDHVSPLHVPVEMVPLVPLEFLRSLTAVGVASLRESWGGETILLPKSAPRTFCIPYAGDGMDRYIRPGSKVLIDPDQRQPRHGLSYLIALDERVLLREFRGDKVPRWVAQSLHQIPDIFAEDAPGLRVLGRAVEAVVRL